MLDDNNNAKRSNLQRQYNLYLKDLNIRNLTIICNIISFKNYLNTKNIYFFVKNFLCKTLINIKLSNNIEILLNI